jgi:hypothetical protein
MLSSPPRFTSCDSSIWDLLNGKVRDWVAQHSSPPLLATVVPTAVYGRRLGHARSDGQERLNRAGFPTTTRQASWPPQPPPLAGIYSGRQLFTTEAKATATASQDEIGSNKKKGESTRGRQEGSKTCLPRKHHVHAPS